MRSLCIYLSVSGLCHLIKCPVCSRHSIPLWIHHVLQSHSSASWLLWITLQWTWRRRHLFIILILVPLTYAITGIDGWWTEWGGQRPTWRVFNEPPKRNWGPLLWLGREQQALSGAGGCYRSELCMLWPISAAYVLCVLYWQRATCLSYYLEIQSLFVGCRPAFSGSPQKSKRWCYLWLCSLRLMEPESCRADGELTQES